uniref:Guanylate cyclase activator 1C n=1 Tax=Buteo japonicus TaxID=224669 RepID=A0A8B9Z1C7_9AVES
SLRFCHKAGDQNYAGPAPEMHRYCSKFMTESPPGQLSLHKFKKLLGLQGLDPQGDNIYFLEFIAAINLVIRGKIDQKLKWYFKLYDADGNGCIDKKELLSIFTAIQAINGYTSMPAEEFTNMIFQKIDVNNDGELTLEEFINGVEKDKDLMELITKSFDLSNVLKVIQNESLMSPKPAQAILSSLLQE